MFFLNDELLYTIIQYTLFPQKQNIYIVSFRNENCVIKSHDISLRLETIQLEENE